jgi:uncharacterized surface protein with fasciclin (FAS1) repeats
MRLKMLLPALVFFYFSIQCNNDSKNDYTNAKQKMPVASAAHMSPSKTLLENIMVDSSYTIFDAALDSTGLVETLSQSGPFTIFAPTNEGFRKLPPDIYESLMQTRKRDLANILSYHIVASSIKTKDLRDGQKLRTLAGEELIVTLRKDKLLVNGIEVANPDIESRNGIIYVINDILFPRNQDNSAH